MNEDELVARSVQSVVDRFKTGHLWVGYVDSYEYEMYFNQDDEISSFCEDIGLDYEYDEDFIIIFDPLKQGVTIDEIIVEIPLYDDVERKKVIDKFSELQLDVVNTFVFYSDPSIQINNYKGLANLYYLGQFNAEYFE